MGTKASCLNSGIQGYKENYSWLKALIYRKNLFWDTEKYMIQKIIYLIENAQSPDIAR